MKTAEEWMKQVIIPPTDQREEYLAIFQQIQLDAMKEGARRAADKCSIIGLQYGDYDPDRDGRIPCNAARDAILNTAEQWTEKDL